MPKGLVFHQRIRRHQHRRFSQLRKTAQAVQRRALDRPNDRLLVRSDLNERRAHLAHSHLLNVRLHESIPDRVSKRRRVPPVHQAQHQSRQYQEALRRVGHGQKSAPLSKQHIEEYRKERGTPQAHLLNSGAFNVRKHVKA